jgi:hypothetical protein
VWWTHHMGPYTSVCTGVHAWFRVLVLVLTVWHFVLPLTCTGPNSTDWQFLSIAALALRVHCCCIAWCVAPTVVATSLGSGIGNCSPSFQFQWGEDV